MSSMSCLVALFAGYGRIMEPGLGTSCHGNPPVVYHLDQWLNGRGSHHFNVFVESNAYR
jgi:hypothetical protein